MDKQKKAHLLGLSHPLNPAVTIAEKGLSETVQFELEAALKAHGLIKVKFAGYNKTEKQTLLAEICQQYKAELVQLIGHIGILYRPKPPKKQPSTKANARRAGIKKPGAKKAQPRGANKSGTPQKSSRPGQKRGRSVWS